MPSKRDTIKAEALRLFATRGVDGVSVQDIATACAMAKPNLYAHFRSKDDLVRELFAEGYRDYGARMAQAIAAPGPFPARLERLVRLVCTLHDEDGLRFRFILMTQHANLPDLVLQDHNPVDIVIGLLREAIAGQEIPPRDPALLAAGIIGLVVQPATFLQYGRLQPPLGAVAPQIVAMCLRAVS